MGKDRQRGGESATPVCGSGIKWTDSDVCSHIWVFWCIWLAQKIKMLFLPEILSNPCLCQQYIQLTVSVINASSCITAGFCFIFLNSLGLNYHIMESSHMHTAYKTERAKIFRLVFTLLILISWCHYITDTRTNLCVHLIIITVTTTGIATITCIFMKITYI